MLRVTRPRRIAVRALIAATASLGLALLPTNMLSGLAVLVRRDLNFGESQLGVAVAIFFGTSSVLSIAGGRLSDRLGPVRALRIGGALSGISLFAIGLFANSWLALALLLMLGGAASAVIQVSASHLLARRIPSSRQGLAYGVMLAGVPLAALFAGAALPFIALATSWRLAFAVAALVAIVVLIAVPPDRGEAIVSADAETVGRRWSGPLAILAVGIGLASAAGTSVIPFIVEYMIARGFEPKTAGLLLSAASLVAVCVRVVAGWLADRNDRDSLIQVSWMLGVGAVSYGVLAVATSPVILVAAMVVAFGAGFGWPGLLILGIVRTNRDAPASALAIVAIGTYIGGMAGPLVFGFLVELVSYQAAWLSVTASAFTASIVVAVAQRMILAAQVRSRQNGGREGAVNGPQASDLTSSIESAAWRTPRPKA